jgi:hypothetical protein
MNHSLEQVNEPTRLVTNVHYDSELSAKKYAELIPQTFDTSAII